MTRLFPALLLSALACLLAAGCAGYRLGTGVERPYESVFIPPVDTQGEVPQAAAIFTTQLRETFIRDGRLRVTNTADEADVVLTIKITETGRRTLTALASDAGLARKLGYTLDARVTLADTAGGKVWFADRPLSIERQVFTDVGGAADPTPGTVEAVQQTQAEYQLVPIIGEALATRVRGMVLDTW